ncbi:hypothetical protein D3D02_13610 [Halobellus sp. Atlit-38R]|uniref:hypothetical protein n=1 Tax=Halobellus sp. Atlit-38R TaxID=2282131 RepID=UPI000EF26B0E|nr:hypothetical protein [Halobellus sp. Atlit-38R]RLM87969.1 hypothetical protein D3D02_13610 [Halobellus sp. Atlit-38R]
MAGFLRVHAEEEVNHTWVLDDDSAREAGRFAAATAALNCTTTGARDTLPSESDVRAFLNDQ